MFRLDQRGRNGTAQKVWATWLAVLFVCAGVAVVMSAVEPLYWALAAFCGLALSCPVLVRLSPRRIPVLNYHSVSGDPGWVEGGERNSVSPELFERQLRYLHKHNYTTIFISELCDLLRGEKRMVSGVKYVALTFDDGYADNWIAAFPLLEQFGMKATCFVSTGLVETRALKRATIRDADDCEPEWRGYLSWPEIREMKESGLFEIQSHGHTHGELSGDELERDITKARLILEAELGARVDCFCWPKNAWTPEGQKAAVRAGYRATVSSLYDGLNTVGVKPIRIARVFVGSCFLGFRNTLFDLMGFVMQFKLFEGYYILYPLLVPAYMLQRLRDAISCRAIYTSA